MASKYCSSCPFSQKLPCPAPNIAMLSTARWRVGARQCVWHNLTCRTGDKLGVCQPFINVPETREAYSVVSSCCCSLQLLRDERGTIIPKSPESVELRKTSMFFVGNQQIIGPSMFGSNPQVSSVGSPCFHGVSLRKKFKRTASWLTAANCFAGIEPCLD